jgi:hypothetical protein
MSTEMESKLSHSVLTSYLAYDPDTGYLTWKLHRSAACPAGTRAGSVSSNGYLRVWILGRRYAAHRIAWFHHYGVWPELFIDHINGDPLDNRIVNLRNVSREMNQQNKRRPSRVNSTGFLGVSPSKPDGFHAKIEVAGKKVWIGRFKSPEAAHQAYLEAKLKLHPGYVPESEVTYAQ